MQLKISNSIYKFNIFIILISNISDKYINTIIKICLFVIFPIPETSSKGLGRGEKTWLRLKKQNLPKYFY